MKTCNICGELKELIHFQKRSSNKDGYTGNCKVCKRAYDNAYYAKNPQRKEYITKNRKNAWNEAKHYIYNYLLSHPCVDCGENDIVVLEFDHVSGEKLNSVSSIKRNGLASTISEIEKCEVRCANCHRRKTAKQFGWNRTTTPL